MSLELYHGSTMLVEFPEIRKTKYKKDFSWGFYCTKDYQQAARWASRKNQIGIINHSLQALDCLAFSGSEEIHGE